MQARSLAAFRTRLATCAIGAFAAFASTLSHATPEPGWWWNPAESGRGFFLEVQGAGMFMAGFMYAEDGSPVWLASNGPMPLGDAYEGGLDAYRDGQTLLGDYRSPDTPFNEGSVRVQFSDDTHGTLTWPGGTVPIERYRFQHGDAAPFQPRTGWWWNPDESGRGFSIELQGDHLFVGAYMYDEAGNAVWYVADGLMESPTRYSGPLLQFSNGQTLTGAYRAPAPPATVGTITVDFSATDEATVTVSDELPQLAAKQGKVITIVPLYEEPTGELPPI